MVLSPSIEYVKEMDDSSAAPNLVSCDGLNVINFFPLPHYGDFPFKDVTEKILSLYKNRLNIIPFSNLQAIRVQRDKLTQYK